MSRSFHSVWSQKLRVPVLPSVKTCRNSRCHAVADANDTVACLKTFLSEQGAGEQQIDLQPTDIDGRDTVIDISVAKTDLKPGDIALRIPDSLVVTLEGIFEDGDIAELLTTDALSELSCLALYLMYEKKRGKESFWHAYISELDRQRARGPQAAESPLIWSDEEVTEYLRGSPVQKLVQARIASIREEYESLDTVWFMSKSLFNKYPYAPSPVDLCAMFVCANRVQVCAVPYRGGGRYDVPTEAFPFEIFRQAFAAVQASVVHLQGVELARRFALVPLGPPSLSYSSTCKAMLTHDDEAGEVQLVVDREYKAGERVYAWCGPQPNSRLMVNYGIVDEGNPYDKLSIVATMINTGPLFQKKRKLLEGAELSTKHTFQLQRGKGLPAQLIPYMQLCYCSDESKLADIDLQQPGELTDADAPVLKQLRSYLQQRLARYDRTIDEDKALAQDPSTPVRQQVACRMLVCEKEILHEALDALMELPNVPLESEMATPIVVDNEYLRLE